MPLVGPTPMDYEISVGTYAPTTTSGQGYANYNDDDGDYHGDVSSNECAWGEDTNRNTSSTLGEMPAMGGTWSETKDTVHGCDTDSMAVKDKEDDGDDSDDMLPFGGADYSGDGSDDIHSAVNEDSSYVGDSSTSYFSTDGPTHESLVSVCKALGVSVSDEPNEADGNLEEERMRLLSARFPLDGQPRLSGVIGRMVLAGVVDEHGELRDLTDQEKAEEAIEQDLDLNLYSYVPDPSTQLSNEEMISMLNDNSNILRPPTPIGPMIDTSCLLDLFSGFRMSRASPISTSIVSDDFEDTDDEEDVGLRKTSAKRTSRSVVIHEVRD